MENITMTNATKIERSRSVCPQICARSQLARRRLIADLMGTRRGTTVSAEGTVMPVAVGAPLPGTTLSAFGFVSKGSVHTDRFIAVVPAPANAQAQQFVTTDVAYFRSGRPPV